MGEKFLAKTPSRKGSRGDITYPEGGLGPRSGLRPADLKKAAFWAETSRLGAALEDAEGRAGEEGPPVNPPVRLAKK